MDDNIMMEDNVEEGTLTMCIRAKVQWALEQLNAANAQHRQVAQQPGMVAQQQNHDRRPFRDYFNRLMDETYFEINRRMIDVLPKFSGTKMDNPLTHLRDLQYVCNALRPREVDEAEFMIRMFLYSLTDYANLWMLSLSVDSMPKWDQMRQLFLKEYSIKQHPQETTYGYLERFNDQLVTCRDYSFPEHVLIICFLDGMNLFEREMMDAMAAGSILDCYPEDVWELIYTRAAQTKPYKFPKSMYPAHHKDTHDTTPQWEQDVQLTTNELSKLIELITQDVSIEPEKESSWQESASRPLAQTECTTYLVAQSGDLTQLLTQPVAQTLNDDTADIQMSKEGSTQIRDISNEYVDTVLGTESMEKVGKDEEPMSPLTPIFMDDKSAEDAIYEEEEEVVSSEISQVVPTTRNKDIIPKIEESISLQRTDTTTEQSIVVYTPNMLHVPNILLSSHISECKHEVLDKEKIRGAHDKVTTLSRLVNTRKEKHNHKRSIDGVHVKWRSRKRARRATMDEEVSPLGTLMRMRQSNYVWKPGWDFYGSANSAKAARKMSRSWNKFDGVHPWAPNL